MRDSRCGCGMLQARIYEGRIEVKCRRCKSPHNIIITSTMIVTTVSSGLHR